MPLTADAARAAAGLPFALGVALLARRAGSLTAGGAAAATGVGAAAVAAGWGWGALLIGYFVASSALSRWRRVERERRTGGVVAKGGARDAAQVLANGGVFALAAVGAALSPHPAWGAAGAAALAAAAADTWATEIGTIVGGTPRSLRTGRPVPPGTSGAVSAAGTTAMVAGAAAVGAAAHLLGVAAGAAAAWGVVAGGVAGAAADSALGATVQARRWCDRCDEGTEQPVHVCGAPTRAAGGLAAIDNDLVNLLCGAVGGGVGWVGWWCCAR